MKVRLEADSSILAVAHGKTGVHLAMDGGDARPVKVGGPVNATTIAETLKGFGATTIRLVGTRHNGTPGWDTVEPEELQSKLPGCMVECLSEAQALHLGRTSTEPEAYIILATRPTDGGHVVGSARWWVEGSDGTVKLADIFENGTKHGQLYTAPGDPLTASHWIVANMISEIIKRHPHIRVVKVWSQDGLSTNTHFIERVVGAARAMANRDFVNDNGMIAVVDTAYAMLSMASKPGSKVSAADGDSEKSA